MHKLSSLLISFFNLEKLRCMESLRVLFLLLGFVFQESFVDAHNIKPKNINETVPAVIVFGDSIVDPGNNNYVNTIVKCNFPPYGRDFIGGKPTGRFSNGRIASDLLAEAFGVKKLLPPYLDPNLNIQDLVTGVSFASGGAGYDPLTAKIVSALSLSDQLDLFKGYLGKIKHAKEQDTVGKILAKGIFIVCTGSDDIVNTYFSTPTRKLFYDINSYTDFMAKSASTFYQELYGLGARRIGVFGVPTLGCVPSQRTLGGGPQRKCSDSANQAAILFNTKLSSEINALNIKFTDLRLVYMDSYSILLGLIENPSQYGFEVANKGCCGTGNIEVSILCNSLSNAKTCPDASKYIFWDSYHPTEKTYTILLKLIVENSINKFF